MALHVPKAPGFSHMLKDGARVRVQNTFNYIFQIRTCGLSICELVILQYFFTIHGCGLYNTIDIGDQK